MKKKIFCITCEHYDYLDDICDYKTKIKINHIGEEIIEYKNPEILNKNNNCKFYKKDKENE